MRDTLPMREIFPACTHVLDSVRRPMHYAELTESALSLLGVPKRKVNWSRQIEDVREKLLEQRQRGCFYVPSPLCLGARQHWFDGTQTALNLSELELPLSFSASVEGSFEALMRAAFMIQKVASASKETINHARARGMAIQAHVTRWFESTWPGFYGPPDNYRQWQRPSNHDFVIRLPNKKTIRVDVVSPSRSRGWDPPERKPKTDLHLLCDVNKRDRIVWKAVVKGTDYKAGIIPEYCMAPERFAVWLNCVQFGIDHRLCLHEVLA